MNFEMYIEEEKSNIEFWMMVVVGGDDGIVEGDDIVPWKWDLIFFFGFDCRSKYFLKKFLKMVEKEKEEDDGEVE